jgi:hypothetical protein
MENLAGWQQTTCDKLNSRLTLQSRQVDLKRELITALSRDEMTILRGSSRPRFDVVYDRRTLDSTKSTSL